ncbi:YjjW family glycine radical enzyme activase [Fusobacterium sp.]|uniref:YjjW family glycine radical enzyme activase n=1 Tax=Fusobacterium sp. TaxID=68766 RepID=UPI002607D75A|nr:YjjW family glycine radical enzyme activase [Fusobacterium sp.]
MESNLTAPLNKIIKFSNVDGPGNRMSIFFQGCNFNCLYCHNPETISMCISCGACLNVCPTKSLSFDENGLVIWNKETCVNCDLCIKFCKNSSSPKIELVDVQYLLKEIKRVKPFIKGITVSGGECTLQYKFLTELFKEVKSNFPDLTCFVDTNGSLDLSEKKYEKFVEITDAFMLDIKAWKKEEHLNLVAFENTNPLKNIEFLKEIGKLYEVRSVIVPNLLDCKNLVKNVATILSGTDIRYKIIKYRPIGVREKNINNLVVPSDEFIETLKNSIVDFKINSITI